MRHTLSVMIGSVLAITLTAPVSAQDPRGAILGRVTDASGAVIANADVRVTNAATGVVASAKTNESGNYVVPYLTPAMYGVTVELTGFKKFVRDRVQVRVTDRVELNIQLDVGNVSEAVEVTADTPVLQTAEASLGQVIDARRVMELPLFAGNAMDLVHLAPGTLNGTDMRLRKAPFNNAPSQFNTDGSGNYGNEFTIDGVSNTYSDGTNPRVAFSPPSASIGEFKVQTSAFDASVGHTAGALVNVSTKGGTNELHGSAWWWLRHSKLDAPNIFQNRSGQTLPLYRDNRYGIAAGGPIYLPKLYNGKNKTFWFFTWEANKFDDPASITATVPRPAWRDGNLSDLLAINSTYQIYDPRTIAVAPNGRFSRQVFPGNIIPSNRVVPMAKNILNLYALPNAAGTADGRNNYFLAGKSLEDYWTTIGRFDHAFSERNRMFVRFNRDFWEEDKNRTFGNDVNGIILNRINRGLAFDDVHVFGPGLMFNFRYGFTQQEFPERRVSRGFDLSALGFSSNLVQNVDRALATIPQTTIGSLTVLSNWESGDGTTSSLTHSFVGDFSMVRGSHSLRFGADTRVYRENRNRFQADVSPLLNFSNLWGRGPLDNSTAPPVGGEITALLLGIPGGSMARSGSYAEQDQYLGIYLHDDYKATRKLTLNIGLRLEHESPITERFNRSVTGFDAGSASPIEAAAIARYAASTNRVPELPLALFTAKGGLTFAGVGGNSREYWNGKAFVMLPRFGFAYSVLPTTVIRGGYGIFYASIGINRTNTNLAGFSRSTPIEASADNGLTFLATLDNPFPKGLLAPEGAAGGLSTNLNQGISFFSANRRQPYAQRMSIGVQQQLWSGFLFETSYVGNRGTRIPVNRNINATPAQYLSTLPTRDQATINFLGANFPSPFFTLHPNYTSSTITRANLLRPYPQFGDINFPDEVGYSWYHSLQTRLEKRFSKGFTLQVSYTFSKTMAADSFLNASDPMPYESLSDADRAHRIVGSGIWELPFGRGRKFGGSWNRPLEFIAGGWQLNGIYQRQSGAPIGFGQALFTGDSSTITLPSTQRNADRWFNTSVFVRTNTQALASNIRTAPLRYSNIRLDSQRRLDLSLIKTFKMTERFAMKFRAETFNAMNEVVLRGPNTDQYNTAFGTITGQEPPRSWQLSLTLSF